MNDNAKGLEQGDDEILTLEFSDEALEAAAGDTRSAPPALSFPSAPTVSILIMCCNND